MTWLEDWREAALTTDPCSPTCELCRMQIALLEKCTLLRPSDVPGTQLLRTASEIEVNPNELLRPFYPKTPRVQPRRRPRELRGVDRPS